MHAPPGIRTNGMDTGSVTMLSVRADAWPS